MKLKDRPELLLAISVVNKTFMRASERHYYNGAAFGFHIGLRKDEEKE